MPDESYEGKVVFRGLVRRGDKEEWENITQVEVEVVATENMKDSLTETSVLSKMTTDVPKRTYYPFTFTVSSHGETVRDVTSTVMDVKIETSADDDLITELFDDDIINKVSDDDLSAEISEDLTSTMSPYFVPYSDMNMDNYSLPLSDIFLYNISGGNMSGQAGGEPYERLEAEYGGWSDSKGGVGWVGGGQVVGWLYIVLYNL